MTKLWVPPKDCKYLAGVDEVGRGALAGPVVAVAVILPMHEQIIGLSDSKLLSESRRLSLYSEIINRALCFSVGYAGSDEIDDLNILQATLIAMKRAVDNLRVQPDFVAVDGNVLPKWSHSSESIIGGDGFVEAISAASIVAKVIRDKEMSENDKKYPGYDFSANKGYGTKKHLSSLKDIGPSPIHRYTFAPIKNG
ncbi:MAG: ribonuclease HII [Cellvibrionales bacterium TMED49]|nr:MAG: ribonuclease HII [Cellvibrionales bacterium TMED49]